MKKTKNNVYTGARFGRWSVTGECAEIFNGNKKWWCRCDCGTERYVLERNLLYGTSVSCGCLRKERAAAAISPELTGRVFGELTVLKKLGPTNPREGVRWLCQCACGETCGVLGTLLVTGRRIRCTGKAHEKNYVYSDITGQKFGRLTAQYPSRRYDKSGSVIWRCQCDCGNEVDVSYNDLLYTNRKSCGCQKREHDQKMPSLLTHVDGTSLDMIKSKKLSCNNTTGHRGVYFFKGKYTARIVFQQKKYNLGTYTTMDEAVQARKEAEEVLFDGVVAHYEQWKRYADINPEWAAANPVQIMVMQNNDRRISAVFLPRLEEISPADYAAGG